MQISAGHQKILSFEQTVCRPLFQNCGFVDFKINECYADAVFLSERFPYLVMRLSEKVKKRACLGSARKGLARYVTHFRI